MKPFTKNLQEKITDKDEKEVNFLSEPETSEKVNKNINKGQVDCPQPFKNKNEISNKDVKNSEGKKKEKSYDDKGIEISEKDGKLKPNNTFRIFNVEYKTDDNGNIYLIDGKKKPNYIYVLNGYEYTTDKYGRPINSKGKPVYNPENSRDNGEQRKAVDESRKGQDQGGHIDAREHNGNSGQGNLVGMDSRINQSDYRKMESQITNALKPPSEKKVSKNTDIIYENESDRPDRIITTVTVDGVDTVYLFDNNLDNSLLTEVPEKGKAIVEVKVGDTGGNISSIIREYDKDDNLLKTNVWITYTDDNGKNQRVKVVISEDVGGN